MTTLTKIAAGHYKSERGEVRNVYCASGAPHTRSARAKWLVTFNGRFGKVETRIVASLNVARALIG